MPPEPGLDEQVPPGTRAEKRVGRRLGRYILCFELASGGMASVYLARAPGPAGFEKIVAIKIIHPHLVNEPGYVDMFLDEARIAARISHPNVCSVFDFGSVDGGFFMAMEYLSGETLSRLHRTLAKASAGAVDSARRFAVLAHIAHQACEGLHAAHELRDDEGELAHLVHRDITPQNLFVGYDGSVRVVDFGVAKATGRTYETTAGTLKGKLAYMSPEQIHGREIDRRSDIFSMGTCLWELLAGRRLFHRSTDFDTLRAVIEPPIPAPSHFRSEIPASLDSIVLRALQRDTETRYSTAREMGQDLGRFVASRGGASGADVAELMNGLFPEGRERQRSLVERARALDPESVPPSGIEPAPSTPITETTIGSPASRPPLRRRHLASLASLGAATGIALFIGAGWDPVSFLTKSRDARPSSSLAAGSTPEQVTPAPPAADLSPRVAGEPAHDPDTNPRAADESPSEVVTSARRASPRRSGGQMTARTGEGTLNVVTPPGWADIFVDGRSMGRSPTELRLPAGRHRVRMLPYGEGPEIHRRIEVTARQTIRLVVHLPD